MGSAICAGVFRKSGKPIAAICRSPWTLIDAGVVKGRTLTSYPSIQTDLKNAGAKWVDKEVVVDNGLVTSRSPDDLPALPMRKASKSQQECTRVDLSGPDRSEKTPRLSSMGVSRRNALRAMHYRPINRPQP